MSTALNIKVSEPGSWNRIISVEIPSERVNLERDRIIRDYQKTARVPGFRQGKIPYKIITTRFADLIRSQLVETVVPEAYKEALSKANLSPITEASIDNLKVTEDPKISFDAKFEVKPEIDLKRLGGFKLKKEVKVIDAKQIDEAIGQLRQRHAQYMPVDRPCKNSDLVVLDYESVGGTDDQIKHDNQSFILGNGSLLKDFETVIIGLKKGEGTEADVPYPDDYQVKELQGKTMKYRIRVIEVKEELLPDLDGEFAKSVGDFETFDELNDKIRRDIEAEAEYEAGKAVREELLTQIIEANAFEIPESMHEHQIRYMIENLKQYRPPTASGTEEPEQDKLREILKPLAEREVRKSLIVDRIAQLEKLEVIDEEVDAEVKVHLEMSKLRGQNLNRKAMEQSGQIDLIKHNLLIRKVFDSLLAKSTVKEVKIT